MLTCLLLPPGFAHLIDSAPIYAQRVLQVLREHDTSKPLFVYMAFQSVHCPMQVPAKYVAPYIHLDNNRQQFAGMLAALDEAVGVIVGGFKARGLWDNTIVIFSTVSDLCVLRACRSVCVSVDDVPMSVLCRITVDRSAVLATGQVGSAVQQAHRIFRCAAARAPISRAACAARRGCTCRKE